MSGPDRAHPIPPAPEREPEPERAPAPAGRGLLIVNADDWGGLAPRTDAILAAILAGRVTSASGMVHMRDSARAAVLARDHDLPIGLHLNLTQPFDGPAVPKAVRARHARLAGAFAHSRWRGWLSDPRLQPEVEWTVRDQLERFAELYARAPTHVDGHNHVHLTPGVLFARSLRGVRRARRTQSPPPGAPLPRRLATELRAAAVRARFATTDGFYSIRRISPDFGGEELEAILAHARRAPVEVMCHPGMDGEDSYLHSPEWGAALAGVRLGSFADLGPTG